MNMIDQGCMEILRKCMEKKMSLDTITQIINISFLQEQKAQRIISELMKIVDKSTEMQLRKRLSDLLV